MEGAPAVAPGGVLSDRRDLSEIDCIRSILGRRNRCSVATLFFERGDGTHLLLAGHEQDCESVVPTPLGLWASWGLDPVPKIDPDSYR